MSDQTPQGPDLDPTSEESVRRLLAEARHTGPVPPEVAARLDDLLGKLVDARAAEGGADSLAARRRRRRSLLLVAAAAAVVLGIGVPTIDRALSGPDSGSDSASDAGSASSAQDRSEEAGAAAGDQQLAAPTPSPPVALTSTDLATEVRRALADRVPVGAFDSTLTLLPAGCAFPSDPAYVAFLSATYDGRPAVLAAETVSDGRQRADLYLCGESDPVRSVTVEVP